MRPSLLEAQAVAAELDEARRTGCPIAPPEELGLLSLSEAYDVQDAVVARREASGGAVSGWKLGLTSRVKQRVMGIDQPVFGRTFAAGAVLSGSRVSRADFIAPRVEPELAFGLAVEIDGNLDEFALLHAIAWVAPALEITDSRYLAGQRSAAELIADDTSAASYVLGERVARVDAPRLNTIETELACNGRVLTAGSTADVLGNPLNALKHLAVHLSRRGLRARSGDIVLSGAITDAFPASRGDRFEARLRGLGPAVVQFV